MFRIVSGEQEILPAPSDGRALSRLVADTVRGEAFYLAPDDRAIDLVEGDQLGGGLLPDGVRKVGAGGCGGEIEPPPVLHVHEEKRHVFQDIGYPEPLVELDTVHDDGRIDEAHVPGMKVPVPLPHESALFSPEEGFPAIVDKGPRVRDEPFIGVLINRYAPVRQDLREVLLRVCPDGLDGAEGIVPVGRRPSVKTGQHRAHFVQAAIGELTLLYDVGKEASLPVCAAS